MYSFLAVLALATTPHPLACSELNAELFSEVPLPSPNQSFQLIAAEKDLVALGSLNSEFVRLVFVREKKIFETKVPSPQGLDLRLARLAVGADETAVLYDRKLGAIISGGNIVNTVSFPNAQIRRVHVMESEILWALDPVDIGRPTGTFEKLTVMPPIPSRSGSYPVMMSTNLVGLNPEPEIELSLESSDSDVDLESMRRKLHDRISTRGGGYFLLFDYTGEVEWKKGTRAQHWSSPKGLRFFYELPEVRAQIEKVKEDYRRKFEQKHAGETFDATKRPVPTPHVEEGRFLPVSVFGARGVSRDTLLVVLNLVATPARAVLVYEPSRSEPRCLQIPAVLAGKNVRVLRENDAAVNDEGLWLLQPFGFFPWEGFLNFMPTEQEQKREGRSSKP